MKTIKSILFILFVVLFTSCGEFFNTPATPTTGGIYGLVCDNKTFDEIAGATVSINSINKSTTSDADGFYYLHDLKAGNYLVSASAKGYHSVEGTVAVEAGKDTMIFIYLEKIVNTASLTGTVVDSETGEKIAGAKVVLNPGNLSTYSNKEGYYKFEDLKLGSYTLTASADFYADVEGEIELTTAGANFTIKMTRIVTTANLTGTVVDSETGENIAGAKVVVNPGNLSTYSNKEGYYEFENLEVGKYTITASADFYADVEGEIELTTAGANITIKMTRTVVEDYSSAIVESFDNRLKCDIVSCRRSGSKVEFKFQFTNTGYGDISDFSLIGSYGSYTIIYDNLGNQYEYQPMSLGNKSDSGYGSVRVPLLEYVGCNGSLSIANVPADAETLTIKLCVSGYDSSKGHLFTYEHISIKNLPIY